jgi:hypothetical protein
MANKLEPRGQPPGRPWPSSWVSARSYQLRRGDTRFRSLTAHYIRNLVHESKTPLGTEILRCQCMMTSMTGLRPHPPDGVRRCHDAAPGAMARVESHPIGRSDSFWSRNNFARPSPVQSWDGQFGLPVHCDGIPMSTSSAEQRLSQELLWEIFWLPAKSVPNL